MKESMRWNRLLFKENQNATITINERDHTRGARATAKNLRLSNNDSSVRH